MTEPRRPVRVSVVVPTRNRDALLRAALSSIDDNRSPGIDLEVLVVDDGAGDKTADIAAHSGARYVRPARHGASAARNRGIEVAGGDYVAFLDDDDVWTAAHLPVLVTWLEEHPDFGAVLGQVRNVDQEMANPGQPWPQALPADGFLFRSLLRLQPQLGATLVRRAVAETVGPFDEALQSDEDWDWHLRLALQTRIGFVPMVSVLFRMREHGADDELQWTQLPYMRQVFWNNVRRGATHSPSLPAASRMYLHHLGVWYHQYIRSALAHARAGRSKRARQSLGRAARVSPLHFGWSLLTDSETRRTATTVLSRSSARERASAAAASAGRR